MKLNVLVLFFTISAGVYASGIDVADKPSSGIQDISFYLEGYQPIDTSDWVKIKADLCLYNSEDSSELIEIAFPNQPAYAQDIPGGFLCFMTVKDTDEDGMTFGVSAVRMNVDHFDNLTQSMVEKVQNSLSQQLLYYGQSGNDYHEYFMLVWIDLHGTMTRYTLFKGHSHVYVLETSVTDDIYLSSEAYKKGTAAYEQAALDAAKSEAFASTFYMY